MKHKSWLAHFALVALLTSAFVIHELGTRGTLEQPFLQHWALPKLRRVADFFTDQKFRLRGPRAPRNPIVIIEVDSNSIEKIGRWPWPRNLVAFLIDRTFQLGASVVGLDLLFSEPELPVPEELLSELAKRKLTPLLARFQTDPQLARVIRKYDKRLVLSWGSDAPCQPLFQTEAACPVTRPEALASIPPKFEFFSILDVTAPIPFEPTRTPIMSLTSIVANYAPFNEAAMHQGFVNAARDPDGLVRRSNVIAMVKGAPFPSMPLEMARVAKDDEVEIEFDERHRVAKLGLKKSGRIPVTPAGIMELNFRGPEHTFTYISAADVLQEGDELKDEVNRKLAGVSKTSVLKNANVIIGVTALALHDQTATPFDSSMPGPEVQATALDNLLSGDMLIGSTADSRPLLVFFATLLLMTVGTLTFAWFVQRLEALPAIGLFAGTLALICLIDAKILFPAHHNLTTGFFYIEIFLVTAFSIAQKYILEEQNKKFLRVAFSKYVSPAVVESIVKDPTKLMIGGQKKSLTTLFSDIRGFTTFSETMDAKLLTEFLNEYFGLMTDIVFQYGGTLDKYIGDALMAFFGAPVDQPNHARNACEAARAMLRTLAEHREAFKRKYGVDVSIGVGVNSGVVSVGNMGSERNFGYTVIGDNVNLASRLEGVSKQYGVNILTTHLTMAEIHASGQEPPPFRLVDVVKVKGKSDAVQLIQILESEIDPNALTLFDYGREAYRDRDWDLAIERFTAASRMITGAPDGDGPSAVFLARCEEFKRNPPPPDWDGSWALDSK